MIYFCVCAWACDIKHVQITDFLFLQASEQDILKYLIKWGEHQLMKRIADRGEDPLSRAVLNQIKQNLWQFYLVSLRENESALSIVKTKRMLLLSLEVLLSKMRTQHSERDGIV